MSVIVDYMIVLDNYEDEAMDVVNKLLDEVDDARHQQFRKIGMGRAGGSKFYTSDVWAAAFNHLIPTDVDDCIASAPWRYPDEVLVIVSGPDYDIDLHARTVTQLRARTPKETTT